MLASTRVRDTLRTSSSENVTDPAGIAPKVSQSVLTAAFLFAFKDFLYELSLKVRKPSTAVKV
jgi:hypothetical protein